MADVHEEKIPPVRIDLHAEFPADNHVPLAGVAVIPLQRLAQKHSHALVVDEFAVRDPGDRDDCMFHVGRDIADSEYRVDGDRCEPRLETAVGRHDLREVVDHAVQKGRHCQSGGGGMEKPFLPKKSTLQKMYSKNYEN